MALTHSNGEGQKRDHGNGHAGHDDAFLEHAAERLSEHYGIGHATLQPEKNPSAAHLAAVHNDGDKP